MKNLMPNVAKLKGVEPPKRDTMYVSSKNDPRLKSYQDSARLSRNPIPKNAYNIRKYKPEITGYAVGNTNGLDNFDSKKSKDTFAKNKIKPVREYNIRENVPAVYIDGQYVPAQKNNPTIAARRGKQEMINHLSFVWCIIFIYCTV
jgi:hypothetical protein